ncbi:MAG: DUF523 domain-containing protein [Candidatus Rifleibacteriota bacterium]
MQVSNKIVLISACLAGVECNYKAKASSAWQKGLQSFFRQACQNGILFVPICPEQLGGLPTPRDPSELQGSAKQILAGQEKIISNKGKDVSNNFIKGAMQAAHFAKLYSARFAILKSKSPSCGSSQVYDGTFSGQLIDGRGITSEVLLANGLKIFNEKVVLTDSEAILSRIAR